MSVNGHSFWCGLADVLIFYLRLPFSSQSLLCLAVTSAVSTCCLGGNSGFIFLLSQEVKVWAHVMVWPIQASLNRREHLRFISQNYFSVSFLITLFLVRLTLDTADFR